MDDARRAVRHFHGCVDTIGALLEREQLGVPLHMDARLAQLVAEDMFVVVLTEHVNERKARLLASGLVERNTPHTTAFGPHVGARTGLAELECALDDAELRVNL